jgi:hypothetical protein
VEGYSDIIVLRHFSAGVEKEEVQGSGFKCLGFRVQGSGFRVQGLGA